MGSKVRGTDIILSAPQVRAARSLLGWSRRELAIVSGVSSGTIKAIEQGSTDPRLSTLRKLARTFKAHSVEFLFEGGRTGVVIAMTPDLDQRRKVARNIPGHVKPTEQDETICEVNAPKTSELKPLDISCVGRAAVPIGERQFSSTIAAFTALVPAIVITTPMSTCRHRSCAFHGPSTLSMMMRRRRTSTKPSTLLLSSDFSGDMPLKRCVKVAGCASACARGPQCNKFCIRLVGG